MSVVESVFSRVYSKGARLFVDTTNAANSPTIDEAYLAGLPAIAGVITMKGPKMGRDVVDMNELDQIPPHVRGLTADIAGTPLTLDRATTPVETPEMYFNKVKAPGDKDIGPIALSMNMTRVYYGKLHQMYIRDVAFLWVINLRVRATVAAAVGNPINTRCFFIGYGYVSELSMDIQPSALVKVSCSIQPMFGVGFLSACKSVSSLKDHYVNHLTTPVC